MSTQEIIAEIDKKLPHFTGKQLEEILLFMKNVEKTQGVNYNINEALSIVMEEDKNLLNRLAQ